MLCPEASSLSKTHLTLTFEISINYADYQHQSFHHLKVSETLHSSHLKHNKWKQFLGIESELLTPLILTCCPIRRTDLFLFLFLCILHLIRTSEGILIVTDT